MDAYDPYIDTEPEDFNEKNFERAVNNEKYWREKLKNAGKYNPLHRVYREIVNYWVRYLNRYNKYWKERNEKASTKSTPSHTSSQTDSQQLGSDNNSSREKMGEDEIPEIKVRRGWWHDREYAGLSAVKDPESEEGLKQRAVLDKEAQGLPLTEEEENILKTISGIVFQEGVKIKEQKERARQRLLAKGRPENEVDLLVNNAFDNYDTLGERFLDSFNKKMQTFKRSDWGKKGLGKKISDFHTLHGDAATLGAGATALAGGALGGYLLYKGVKKLIDKNKEPQKPDEPVYNQMPMYAPPDQASYPYPFPMADPYYQLPPQYYYNGPTKKIRVR